MAGFNDPRIGFVLDTAFLDKSPVYLRFEPVGEDPNWNLKTVFVLVYVGQSSFYGYFTTPAGSTTSGWATRWARSST